MKKVLLVEDDQFISDLYGSKLVQAGFEVKKTSDGESVLPLLEEFQPDILLLDLMLPNRHGFDILTEVRAQEAFTELPVLVLTNETGSDVEERAATLQAEYFFKAMTDISELVPKIEKILNS